MTPKKIFIVDDEPEILKMMEKALARNGYKTASSTSPIKALDKIFAERYDIVITDMKMPEMSGMELLEKLKKAGYTAEVVVSTAHATIDTAVECLRKGAADYLIKPFEINELLATIEKAMEIGALKSRLVTLEELDKLKDEFISTVTHELKTPLMAISGAIELLAMSHKEESDERRTDIRRTSDRDVRKFLEIIERQSAKMKAMVEDILDFARMEAGRVELKKTPVSLAELAREVISETGAIAESKNITVENPSSDAVVDCDRQQIKRAASNLVVNAVKYTDRGGHVKISIRETADGAEFEVSDDGIGISPELLKKIFDKFFRVDQSLKREAGGFGLGLTITKKIIELHGGRIKAESDGPGKGSKISFSIPF